MNDHHLKAALAYAESAMAVFPCRGKMPAIPKEKGGKGCKDATTDLEQVQRMWGDFPKSNIGMATGKPSGIWVLDVDGAEGEASLAELEAKHGPLPATVVSLTGKGGRHLLFRYRGEPIRNRVGDIGTGLDVRATGGYIIVPPSRHPDTGKQYRWADGLRPDAIADAPAWLIDLACGENRARRQRQSDQRTMGGGAAPSGKPGGAWAEKALENECRNVAQAATGGRNDRLNKAAFNLGQLVGGEELERGRVERELFAAAAACGLVDDNGESAVLATIKSGLDGGEQKPRHRPAPEPKVSDGRKANGGAAGASAKREEVLGGDWYDRAITGSKGQVLGILANAMLALRDDPAWNGVLAYDEMQATALLCKPVPRFGKPPAKSTYPRPIRDDDVLQVQEWFQIAGLPTLGKDVMHDAVDLRARECGFHPVRDYLTGLRWDGVERLETWLHTCLGAEDTPYTRAIGRMFMVSAVARILKPGCKCDYMMILEGRQGARKSTACRILGGGWFADSLPENVASKDAAQHLRGKWMIEAGEMHALSKSETTALKAFITRQVENYRPSYGRKEVHEPRQCVFIGTTNKAQYLKDETGARRFWPVKVAVVWPIDTDLLAAMRDQLFAEAVHRFGVGEHWWPDEDFEREHIKPEQDARFDTDAWEEPISDFLAGRKSATIMEVAVNALNMEKGKVGRREQNQIIAVMERLNWERSSKRGTGGIKPWVPRLGTE